MNIFFVSLGCDKNLVDSEMMITSLRKNGFVLTDDIDDADVIVVNTCCFIGDAKEESINTLIEMGGYKEGRCKLLVAAGCLAQRYHNEIKEDIPEVDLIVGTMGYEDLSEKINEALGGKGVLESLKDIDYLPTPLTDRDSMSGGYYAYLKIAEGCDKCCTYCVIPKVITEVFQWIILSHRQNILLQTEQRNLSLSHRRLPFTVRIFMAKRVCQSF